MTFRGVWNTIYSDAVILQGTPVELEGLVTYTPTIDLGGEFDCAHRTDQEIIKALNVPGAYKGVIVNRENIGKTADELVALWNKDHPDDPVV